MSRDRPLIYWANAMFSEADRTFNAQCVARVREAGFAVFLPQETAANVEHAPSATAIFRSDTAAVLEAAVMVACIDQDGIDSGVACEIGMAFAAGIPIIGLYTDIRQFRSGDGHMYKNLYVIGALEVAGQIVTGLDQLLGVLPQYLPPAAFAASEQARTDVAAHFGTVASDYSNFVELLESWYRPHWTQFAIVEKWIRATGAKRIFDFGCGTGTLAQQVCAHDTSMVYVGYDHSEAMIKEARKRAVSEKCFFASTYNEIRSLVEGKCDLAVATFSLHDDPSQEEVIRRMAQCLTPNGLIGIIDLSTDDLPKLTRMLRRCLARPVACADRRLNPNMLARLADDLRLQILTYELVSPAVAVPTADDLLHYCDLFGIFSGMDLPLCIHPRDSAENRRIGEKTIRGEQYPFHDRRVFAYVTLRKA